MRIKQVPQDIVRRLAAPVAISDSILPFFKANPSSLNEWLETLPKCNPAETCSKILPAMETMNLTALPGHTRYELIECLRPYVFEYMKTGETALLDASFPLKQSVAEAVRYSVNFQQALADAYKAVLVSEAFVSGESAARAVTEDTDQGPATVAFNEQQQATVIHRALQSIRMAMLRCAQSYQPEPQNIWDQINALYALAESHMLHRLRISDPECSRCDTSTIEEQFKQLHFFRLAVPNRFRQRDIQLICQLLEDNAKLIQLLDTHGSGDQEARFLVDLDSSQPAQHISKVAERNTSLRYFHTKGFIEHLKSDQIVVQSKAELIDLHSSVTKVAARTILRLLQCWHKISARQFSRQAEDRDVTLYPGLQNIIKRLLNVPDTEQAKGRLRRQTGTGQLGDSLAHLELIPHENDHLKPSLADNLRSERSIESMLKTSKSNTSTSDIWKQASRKKPSGATQKVAGTLADSSAKGYQLKVLDITNPIIKVGDLVGIRQSTPVLEIAVIRHLTTLDEGAPAMGVELIAPNAEVARILNDDDNIRSRSVLLLPPITAIKQPPSILSISQLTLPNNQIELMINKQRQHYQITKLLETNPAFTQYSLHKLDP